MEKTTKETKQEFIRLQDLTEAIFKKLPKINVRMQRRVTNNGLSTSMTLKVDDATLQIPLVSSERTATGSRQLRYFLPDKFMAILFDLGLPQKDALGKDRNLWNYPAAIRFVKGKYKNSDNEYHSIEVIFKKFQYHTHFLTPNQLIILENLEKKGLLTDYQGKKINVKWEIRPDDIDVVDIETFDISFD